MILPLLLGALLKLTAGSELYGREALAGLSSSGIAIQVICNAPLDRHRETFRHHLETRLRARGMEIVAAGDATLKLLLTAIPRDEEMLTAHLALELDRSAWLSAIGRPADAPVWDIWKMGEYREAELLSEIDELAHQFLRDCLSVN